MKLYGDPASPYVTRVILYARLKGIELQRPPVPGDNPRSPEFHVINPLGKVPALELADQIIPESEVICEYLEDAFPDNPGLPDDPLQRMISRLVARITDLYISPHFRPLLDHLDPAVRDSDAVAQVGGIYAKAFSSLAHYMRGGTFCAGSTPTLGDCALGPYIKLLKNVVFPVFPEIPDPTARPGRLHTWWRALEEHELCGTCLDEYGNAVDAFMDANRDNLDEHR